MYSTFSNELRKLFKSNNKEIKDMRIISDRNDKGITTKEYIIKIEEHEECKKDES